MKHADANGTPCAGEDGVFGRISRIRIVPFYDRSALIGETLGTLQSALRLEVLVTIVVIVVMLAHLGTCLIVSGLLPLAVLSCFVAMRVFGVHANVMALSGIAIAIGTMVDMGIVIVENVHRHLEAGGPGRDTRAVVAEAAGEVGGAVLTAVATTIVGFLPVFAMHGAEAKLFRPLAFTKTFALVGSLILAVVVLPPLTRALLPRAAAGRRRAWVLDECLVYAGLGLWLLDLRLAGAALAVVGVYRLIEPWLPAVLRPVLPRLKSLAIAAAVMLLLARVWAPLGVAAGTLRNFSFIVLVAGGFLLGYSAFARGYPRILAWCLEHKRAFLALFGIASDDGVVMATYLEGAFRGAPPPTVSETRALVVEAARKRVRPCLMTTATTVLALLPVLSSTGRGADIMRPMALPSVGGMTLEVITMLTVPVLYCALKERRIGESQSARPGVRGRRESGLCPERSQPSHAPQRAAAG